MTPPLATAARMKLAAHRDLLLAVVVTAALAVAFFTGKEPRGPTARLDSDAYYYYVALPSLVIDGDLDLSNQYAIYGNWYGFGPTATGRPGNVFGIGPALFAMPFFLFGRAIAIATGARLDGFSRPEVLSTLFASVLATAFAVVFATRLVRRRFGELGAPALTALVTMLSGPVVYYAIRQPGYAHPFGTLFAAWLVDFWDQTYERGGVRSARQWLSLGALFGAAVLARPQLAPWGVLLLAAAVDDLRRATRSERSSVALRLAGAAGMALIVLSPQLFAWRAIYGRALLVPQGSGFLAWSAPALTEVLWSARNGLFAWAPLYALGAVGLVLELRSRAGRWLAAAVLLQVLVNGAAWDWWAGGSFGGRRFCSTYAAFAFGVAAVLVRVRRALDERVAGVGAQAALLFGATTALGNVSLALSYASSTVRIEGGEPPSRVIEARLGPRLGKVYGAMSDAVMVLPRALFALRYGAPMSSYDAIVGVYHLDELYPGLNIREAPRRAELTFAAEVLPPYALGLQPSGEGAKLGADRAALLLSLNEHRRSIDLEVEASAPIEISWNGRPLGAPAAPLVRATAPDFRRGINVLEVRGRPGTSLVAVRLASR